MSDVSNFPTSIDDAGTVTGTQLMNSANTAGLTHSQMLDLLSSIAAKLETELLAATVITTNTTAAAFGRYFANASGGALTVTLPTAPHTGSPVGVVKTDSSANAVTVSCPGGETFPDGSTSVTISSQDIGGVWIWDGAYWVPQQAQPGAFVPVTYGLYANRPTASSAGNKAQYYATDVLEAYRSDGTNWYVISGPGTEIGYAQTVSNQGGMGGGSAIPGVSITVTGGDCPLKIETRFLFGASSPSTTTDIVFFLRETNSSGTELAEWHGTCPGTFVEVDFDIRVPALAGATQTYLVTCQDGATGTVYASATYPAYIRATLL